MSNYFIPIVFTLLLGFVACNNYGIMDALEDPGDMSG